MNAVIYYSNAGECKRIAEYAAEQTGFTLADINTVTEHVYDTAVIVFPVYCQNVPQTVSKLLQRLQTKYVALIAAYGKMSYGRVLYEIQRKCALNVIAAAYVPTKHAYLNEPRFDGFEKLAPLIKKIRNAETCPTTVDIPRSGKNPFASFAPKLRSRIGCKIVKNEKLCNDCRTCERNCALNAVKLGKPDRNCIRCTRCVASCPQGALSIKLKYPMRQYLNKHKKDEMIIYV